MPNPDRISLWRNDIRSWIAGRRGVLRVGKTGTKWDVFEVFKHLFTGVLCRGVPARRGAGLRRFRRAPLDPGRTGSSRGSNLLTADRQNRLHDRIRCWVRFATVASLDKARAHRIDATCYALAISSLSVVSAIWLRLLDFGAHHGVASERRSSCDRRCDTLRAHIPPSHLYDLQNSVPSCINLGGFVYW
jgi:hypothetical protein